MSTEKAAADGQIDGPKQANSTEDVTGSIGQFVRNIQDEAVKAATDLVNKTHGGADDKTGGHESLRTDDKFPVSPLGHLKPDGGGPLKQSPFITIPELKNYDAKSN